MSAEAEAFASGKLILAGEHAVVHGQPAIAFAVDRGTHVRLRRRPGPRVVDAPLHDPLLDRALDALLGPEGFEVTIRSTLPLGRGMGSSASLSVALVRALRALPPGEGPSPEAGDELEAALALERVFHDNPSGVDVAVASRGGVLRYRRGTPPRLEPLPCPAWSAVVIDTGRAGSTKALVAGVTARRPAIDGLLARIGEVVDEAGRVVADPAALGPLLTENHRLLAAIGVSTPELDALVELAVRSGAHGAKLSGAGGGGVVLALHDAPETLVAAARARGYDAWPCRPMGAP